MSAKSATRLPMQFSISQIAHFNRCLFPGDFERDLIRHGVSASDALAYSTWLGRNRTAGIVGFYQEFAIDDPALASVVDALISEVVETTTAIS